MGERTFLKFSAGPSTFGLQVTDVIETIRVVAIAPVPSATRDLLGVVNVRGNVIPVFDLCRTLELSERPLSLRMYIVIASVEGEPLGILVDDVLDVVTVPMDRFQISRAVTGPDSFTAGVVRIGDELLTVLDLAPLVDRASHAAPPVES
jgi:purine-binding chemotaxis protein CheW